MSTSYSPANAEDSGRAHQAAREQFYPLLFPGCGLAFTDTTDTILDLGYAIDCKIDVTPHDTELRAPLSFSIQERWRFDLPWITSADVTVTEWNLSTGLPSELHKLGAHLLVYGFYDRGPGMVVCAAAIDVPRLLHALALGRVPYTRRKRAGQDQSFLAFRITDLHACDAVVMAVDVKNGCPWGSPA